MSLSEITRLVIEGAKKTGSYYATYPTKKEGHMTREEIDTLWHKALQQAIKDGEEFTRYHFAHLVAAAEREACLDWCAAYAADDGTAQKIAAAIRARGDT